MNSAGELHQGGEQRTSIITDRLRRGYVVSNGLASVVELSTGLITGDVARMVDGAHGSAEIVIGNTQMKDAHETDHVLDHKRKNIYRALAGFSLAGAGVAAGEMAGAWQFGIESAALDKVGFGAAAVAAASSLVTAGILVKRIKQKYLGFQWKNRGQDIEPTEKDVVKHIVLLDMPTSALALMSGAVRIANEYTKTKTGDGWLETTEQAIGITSGLWGAFLFRPTRANLEHHHGHETISEPVEDLMDIHHHED